MDENKKQELTDLFNRFAQETQASSFAVENLYNKVINLLNNK